MRQPARRSFIGQVGILADLDIRPANSQDRAATERAERAGDDRQQAQQIADPAAQTRSR